MNAVEIALALACTRGHAHDVPFESSALIGHFEFLARDFPYIEYIAHLILSSPPNLLLSV